MKKLRVDLLLCNPETLQWVHVPGWEWDGECVRELDSLAEDFRETEYDGRIYTFADGLDFLQILRKTVRGTFVAATEPYEVEE